MKSNQMQCLALSGPWLKEISCKRYLWENQGNLNINWILNAIKKFLLVFKVVMLQKSTYPIETHMEVSMDEVIPNLRFAKKKKRVDSVEKWTCSGGKARVMYSRSYYRWETDNASSLYYSRIKIL